MVIMLRYLSRIAKHRNYEKTKHKHFSADYQDWFFGNLIVAMSLFGEGIVFQDIKRQALVFPRLSDT